MRQGEKSLDRYNIGLDIGGTKCTLVSGKSRAEALQAEDIIMDRISFPTNTKNGVESTLETIYDSIDSIIKKNRTSNKTLNSIGISCGGPLDLVSGVILSPPNLYGWDNVPIVEILHDRYRVPVRLQNDANAGALAEWRYGAARGCSNVIFITMGTGLGAGLILNGRLFSGANGMAGEVGHIRLSDNGPVGYGKEGSFEGFCSGGGIAQVARVMALEHLQQGKAPGFCKDVGKLEEISARAVAEAAQKGDPVAISVFKKVGHYLGRGLAVLIDILNPEMIVIGSIFERNRELLMDSVEAVLEKECLARNRSVCQIVPAQLGDRISDFAALTVAEYDE